MDNDERDHKDDSEDQGGNKQTKTAPTEADKETGDPGRTPGMAEGVEDVEEHGNQ